MHFTLPSWPCRIIGWMYYRSHIAPVKSPEAVSTLDPSVDQFTSKTELVWAWIQEFVVTEGGNGWLTSKMYMKPDQSAAARRLGEVGLYFTELVRPWVGIQQQGLRFFIRVARQFLYSFFMEKMRSNSILFCIVRI